jgi:hypothetical protein
MPFLNDCDGDLTVKMRTQPGGGDTVHSLIWGDPLTATGIEIGQCKILTSPL